MTKNLQFVKNEIKRYNKRFKTKHSTNVTNEDIDIYENFTSVAIRWNKVGYAKRNPQCDELDIKIGLSIATWRALKRIDGRV